MKIKYLLLIIVLSIATSCKFENKATVVMNTKDLSQEGLVLIQQKCYACHSITSKSHDEIIAPPMVAVKRRYKMSYTSEEDFVNAMTAWVMDPKNENALMRGAVQNFKVMPKQLFNEDEIIKIAKYMYHNTLETPEWFEAHFKEEHPRGMGNSKGKNKFNN